MATFCLILKPGATGPAIGGGCAGDMMASDFFLFLSFPFCGDVLASFLVLGKLSYTGAALANESSSDSCSFAFDLALDVALD